ncbi:MAG: hypothetical protein CVU17_05560 [Betaproteobacteria bacterium HGW-Betaproteobacteria-11]|nr:MAG: hypothetical protein CVU17_05560 [Betaproteobacteria bacterium HGW-Betaproteobacteria-11]
MQTLQTLQTRPKLLYPSMVIAAITVTVFSLLGIASMTGILPLAHSEGAATGSATARQETLPPAAANAAAPVCRICGTVEAVDLVETKGQGSGVGAVAGGVAGALIGNSFGGGNGRTALTLLGGAGGAYAGNEIEKNVHKSTSYRIRVRLENGGLRTLYQRNPPAVAAGDRVRIVDGGLVRQS